MPALAFFAWVGLALVALLFVADATLVDNGSAIVVSERIGLPEPWHPDPDSSSPPALASIPAPEISSQAEISAQFGSEPGARGIEPAARAARAEAPPKKKRVARQSADSAQSRARQSQGQQSSLADRFSIRGQ